MESSGMAEDGAGSKRKSDKRPQTASRKRRNYTRLTYFYKNFQLLARHRQGYLKRLRGKAPTAEPTAAQTLELKSVWLNLAQASTGSRREAKAQELSGKPIDATKYGAKTEMKKFDWERAIWLAFALLGCVGLLVFLGTTARHYWQNNGAADFWDLATAVFAFFGTLMTAGAAFATVAAVVSYFSINDKLRDAKSSLDQFNELDQQRQQLKKYIAEMTEYQATVQDLEQHDATETDQSASIAVAQQILQNPHADFESRLKARAIVWAEEMRRKFKEIEISPSENQWRELIAGR